MAVNGERPGDEDVTAGALPETGDAAIDPMVPEETSTVGLSAAETAPPVGMRQTLKGIARHSAAYGLGSMLPKFIGLLLLPVYTTYLTTGDYGIMALLTVTTTLTAILSQAGLGSALFREVIYSGTDERTAESTALYFMLGESALLYGALILAAGPIAGLVFGTVGYTYLLRLMFGSAFLGAFQIIVMAQLRIREKSMLYAALAVVSFVINVGLNILYLVVLRQGLTGMITATFVGSVITGAMYAAILARYVRLTFSWPVLKRMLTFGLPLVPAALAAQSLVGSDRFFLQHWWPAQVGVYQVGYSIGLGMNLIVQAVQLAWPAQMFAIAKRATGQSDLGRMLTYYLLMVGSFGLAVAVLAPEAVHILVKKAGFYPAATVVPLIALSYLLYGSQYITGSGMQIKNKTRFAPPIFIGAAVLNLGLNFLLIPPYGMMGAAVATVLSYLALAVAQTAGNLYFWHVPYQYLRIAKLAGAWALVFGASALVNTGSLAGNAAVKTALLLAYPGVLYVLGFYEPQELAAVRASVRTRLRRR